MDVTTLTRSTGAGPTPKTVVDPASIWVLPLYYRISQIVHTFFLSNAMTYASWIVLAHTFIDWAVAWSNISSSSDLACTVILACL